MMEKSVLYTQIGVDGTVVFFQEHMEVKWGGWLGTRIFAKGKILRAGYRPLG